MNTDPLAPRDFDAELRARNRALFGKKPPDNPVKAEPPSATNAEGLGDHQVEERGEYLNSEPVEVQEVVPGYGATLNEWLHVDLVLGLSDDLLPVVANPNAEISPHSDLEKVGKVPSEYNRAGKVRGIADWTHKTATVAELALWSKQPDYGICLQSRHVRALDVDVTDPETAQRIEVFINEHLPGLPTRRRSDSSKFLMALRVVGNLPKRSFKTGTGEKDAVEFLGDGNQFVVAGTNPSGARITWDGGLPDDFPIVDPAVFEEVWAALVAEFAIEPAGAPQRTSSFASAGRNNLLTSEAGKLRNAGMEPEVIAATLEVLNKNLDTPLPDKEVKTIARSVGKYPIPEAVKLELRPGANGPIADEENVRRILLGDVDLTGMVAFDEFRAERILRAAIPEDTRVIAVQGLPRPWADEDTGALQAYIQRRYIPRIGVDRIERMLNLVARRYASFHPIRDYLNLLKWDGTPRVGTWLATYVGATEQPEDYLAAVGLCFLISAVARIQKPGCQADSALVLEGPQGIYKSTALRALASDEFFSDSLPADLAHKDARDHLRGKWIIELSELAQFKKSEIETVKAFLSRRFEQYRPSYGRHEIQFPRQCVFAGSTNSSEYLVDSTGNRRFWVVVCGRIDIDAIRRDRDQLWAEAMVRYRAGDPWHLSGDVAMVAARHAEDRVAHDPWTADVACILESNFKDAGDAVAPGEVLRFMNLTSDGKTERSAMRVAKILIELGWKRVRRHKTRGQLFANPAAREPRGTP